MASTIEIIDNSSDEVVKEVTSSIQEYVKEKVELQHYQVVWKELQDVAASTIIKVINPKLKDCVITTPPTKSAYPDIKIIEGDKILYAIDVKSNELQKNPWFDMGRLDTYVASRLKKYKEEWELVIQYDSKKKTFVKCYFLLSREAVGYSKDSKGIKYRPYDGKVRPKTWDEFEDKTIYWDTPEKFLEGLKASAKYRLKKLLTNSLIPILDEAEKDEFKKLFEKKKEELKKEAENIEEVDDDEITNGEADEED